ncbi:MAG: LPS-assembly protein LptD [Cyclobacteriaceae bacterium]|nr:LPS-assembly protein LptD [Cyclobacteriaceae bacterium]UYN86365.1 MAG: LPS-assembly protein LptD [Cyclobacteriaceae bacterium]
MNFSLKAKNLAINTLCVRSLFILAVIGCSFSEVWSQLPVAKDSLRATLATDTIKNPADTLPPKKGDIETTIKYSARDSIHTSVDGQMIWLYGAAKIIYGAIELEAEEITIDYANSTLTAHGIRDSLGRRVGYPIFKNGPELYETKDITYNFKTGRARISEVITQQGEGYLHGDVVYKNEKNELLSVRNRYTTCNLEHPHFEIRSTKTKAIPNDKIVSGPFYLQFNDIPLYPFGFLFGMFPAKQESTSGILFPSYGEDRIRGFNLRGLGYFLDASEYVKLSVRADLFSKGDYVLYFDAPYSWRYHFTGGFNFSYSKTNASTQIEAPNITNDFSIRWNHSPQSKGTGRFSASVSAASSSYNKNNNLNFGMPGSINTPGFNNTSRKMNSNISYNKIFKGTPFSMGINISHNQDLVTEQVDLTAPTLTVNMRNLYPFQRKDGTPTKLDNFSIGYSMAATNRITNNLGRVGSNPLQDSIAPFTFSNLSTFIENGRNGIRHAMPVSYSFKAFRYFTVSPSISYEEKWYFEKYNWEYQLVNNRPTLVATDTIRGFNRIANYSFSTGFNTRIYGTYFFKRGNIKAIRHVVNPNISIGYTPDFTKYDNYFQAIQQNDRVIYQSRHQGAVYGGSTTGKSGSIGIGLGNTLEMKVKSAKDTVARKVSLLNSLSLGTSYNIIADSFKLAPISIAANTNILDNLINVNIAATLDPYTFINVLDPEGVPIRNLNGTLRERRIDQLAIRGGKLGRITSATLALGSNLNPKAREANQDTRERIAGSNMPEQEKQYYLANPDTYIDFNIPWSLQLNYSLNYSRPINAEPQISQSLQFSGDMSLSEKWKITFNSGFDFENMEFTTTNVGITRDLHCWTMNFNWGPFGRFTYYNFRIAVKASVLQDLKLERRKPFLDSLR